MNSRGSRTVLWFSKPIDHLADTACYSKPVSIKMKLAAESASSLSMMRVEEYAEQLQVRTAGLQCQQHDFKTGCSLLVA